MSPTPQLRHALSIAMLLVSTTALGACSGEPGRASVPSPSTQVAPDTSGPVAPEALVDSPKAILHDVVVSATDPDVRAAVWRSCSVCNSSRYALAITKDGFATRVIPQAVWRSSLVPHVAPDGSVLLVSYTARTRLEIVDSDGELRHVARTESTRAVQPGEIVAGVDYKRVPTFYATDLDSALAHLVPVPPGTFQLSQVGSAQLRAFGRDGQYHWSDDGGSTWRRADIPDQGPAGSLVGTATSEADTHAVVLGGDGATLFPFGFAARLNDDNTWTVYQGPRGPTAFLGGQVALPDGRLLVATVDWSDRGTFKKPLPGTPPGLYISEGTNWSSLSRIDVGAPFAGLESWRPDLLDVSVAGKVVTIVVHGTDFKSAFLTRNLGETWTKFPTR